MVQIPTLNIATNTRIPIVGFGTAEYPFGESKAIKQAVLDALEAGYRHFDTAALYHSETPLGEGIAEALNRGLIQSRDELFITSKLWSGNAHRDLVVPALQKSIENLGVEYLDLYLIHLPVSLKRGTQYPFSEEDIEAMDMESVWEGMEECVTLGLTKSIGVSNFTCKKLERLISTAKIPPAVNQVEMSPLWQQEKLRKYCKDKGIHITAYSPLGAKGAPWASGVMNCEVLNQIAKAKGKTIAQVCLRWVYEQGVSIVVKSFNKERMKNNIDIFDWNLDKEDLQMISGIPQNRGVISQALVSEHGPFKSVEDLWDGEM